MAAHAAVLLTYGQSGGGSPIIGTANGTDTATHIATAGTAVTITNFLGGGTPISAFLNLSANSTGAATLAGGDVTQTFSGTWSITSLANGGGTNYLSASFTDAVFGLNGGSGLTMEASQPPQTVAFTSSVLPASDLMTPAAMSLSFANVSPSVGICGTTLCSFTASVSGTNSASATATPEPASLALLGSALIVMAGTIVLGRHRRTMG